MLAREASMVRGLGRIGLRKGIPPPRRFFCVHMGIISAPTYNLTAPVWTDDQRTRVEARWIALPTDQHRLWNGAEWNCLLGGVKKAQLIGSSIQ